MYNINLIRERASEDMIWVDSFQADDSVINPEQTIRDVIKEFLSTEEGKVAIEYTCHDFNWGDAVVFVPEKIWNKHGLYFQNAKSFEIRVDQDEILTPEIRH